MFRTVVSSLLAFTLGAVAPSSVLAGSAQAGPGTVLGLDSDDAMTAEDLTAALRKAFAKQGVSGGQELTLAELRLTFGCEGEDVSCLAEGGKGLEVETLVFGNLEAQSGGRYMLELKVVDVAAGTVSKETREEVLREDLGAKRIDATADRIVSALYGDGGAGPPAPAAAAAAPPDAPPDPAAQETPKDKPKPAGGKLVWGKADKVPAWKWALLGVSGGLTVVSLATAIGTTVALRGPVRNDLIRAAEDSLTDERPQNDIDPEMEGDLCAAARLHPEDDDDPDTVTNAAVTEECNRGDNIAAAATATWITTGVFALATAISTAVIFVHREKPAASALRRRGVTVGAAPTRGGFVLGGGVRF